MGKILLYTLFIITLIFVGSALAQPTITSANQIDGEISIIGSGFGAKTQAAPQLWEDFESYADGFLYASNRWVGATWNGTSCVGGTEEQLPPSPWGPRGSSPENFICCAASNSTEARCEGHWDAYSRAVVVDSMSVDGKGMVLEIRHVSTAPILYLLGLFEPTGVVYLDMDTKVQTYGNAGELGNAKPWRLNTTSNNMLNNMYYNYSNAARVNNVPVDPSLGEESRKFAVDAPSGYDDNCLRYYGSFSHAHPFGYVDEGSPGIFQDWVSWKFEYVEGDYQAHNGYIRNTFNIEYVSETSTFCDRPGTAAGSYDSIRFGGQMATNGYVSYSVTPESGVYTWYDHIYLDNTLQRVEIGDNPVYEDCTTRDVQVASFWETGEIIVDARLFRYANDDTAYVFVVDVDGTPSAGEMIIVGTEGGEVGQPGQPQNLAAEEN